MNQRISDLGAYSSARAAISAPSVATKSASGPKNCNLKSLFTRKAICQRRLASLKSSTPIKSGWLADRFQRRRGAKQKIYNKYTKLRFIVRRPLDKPAAPVEQLNIVGDDRVTWVK